MVKGVCFLPLPLGDARGGRDCGRGVGGVRGGTIEKRKLPDLNQSERLRAHAPSAANFATQKFAPVHASHEHAIATPQIQQRKENEKQTADAVCFSLAPLYECELNIINNKIKKYWNNI